MNRVIVHIDRLVLKGFRHEDRYGVAEGLRQELGRLLAEPSVARRLASRGDAARVGAGQLRLTPGMPPVRIGERAAGSIAREIGS